MFRSKNKIVLLVIAFVLSITGVFGAWTYAEGVIEPVTTIVDISLFEWLPGMGTDDDDEGGDNLDSAGTNHNDIIIALVPDVTNSSTQTNLNTNSVLVQNIKNYLNNDKNSISGQDSITGGNMKHLFPSADGSSRLVGLIIQFGITVVGADGKDDVVPINNGNTYYVFTFDTVESQNGDEWSNNKHVGELAVVWRTTLNKVNGEWTRGVSEQGYAPKIAGNKNKDGLSVDHHKWVKGEIPKS